MSASILRRLAISICCILGFSGAAACAAYPDKTVHFMVGFEPGGGTDALARLFGKKLGDKWGQAVITENRPGADGSIAENIVAHAAPDGYMIAWVTNAHTITPNEYKLDYDPIKSFEAITSVASTCDVLLVPTNSAIKSVQDVIALAKSKPGKLSFGTAGAGTLPFMEMALFMHLTNTDMVHVPYKGGGPQMVALLGGEIDLAWGSLSTMIGQLQAGKLRPLAVSTGARSVAIPSVPTIEEAAHLKGFDTREWFGVLAPAGTPTAIVNQIHRDIVQALRDPDVQNFLNARYFVPGGETPEQFSKIVADDIRNWSDVVKSVKTK